MVRAHGRRAFLATLGTVALAGCGGDGGGQTVDADVEISVVNNAFEPSLAVAEPGDTIAWTVEEGEHTVTAYHPDNDVPRRVPEGASGWHGGDLSSGDTFTTTLETEGVYDYSCRNHYRVGMVGSLVVGSNDDPDQPGLSDPADLTARTALQLRQLNADAREELGI